jgi:hypothetical protein
MFVRMFVLQLKNYSDAMELEAAIVSGNMEMS